mgnify:CR=1 FL=1
MTGKTIKCRSCAGNMDFTEGVNKIFCLYCGTQNFLTDVLEIPEVDLTCHLTPGIDYRTPIRISGMERDVLNKIPPCNLEAEQAALGSMIIEPDTIPVAAEILRSEDFYIEGHQIIFKAIVSLYERGELSDIITINSELKKLGKLEEIGGKGYLTTLINTVPTAANIEHYAKIVAENSFLREIIKTGIKIIELGYREDSNVEEVIDSAESTIFQLSQRQRVQDFVHLSSLMRENFRTVERIYHNKSHITGVKSGFAELDRITAGFQPGELIILAGRHGMGKTSLALNIARLVAVNEKLPVAIFSLGMSKEQVSRCLICSQAMVDAQKFRTGYLNSDDLSKLTPAMSELSEAQIYIDDTPGISIMEMKAKARRLKMRRDIQLIIVDYLQLISSTKSATSLKHVKEILRGLKFIAKEFSIPVICLSQLSHALESRTDKRPKLSDFIWAGKIEQIADMVAFIYRDDYYNPKSDRNGITEIIISKQSNGPIGTVELLYLKNYTKFVSKDKYDGSS